MSPPDPTQGGVPLKEYFERILEERDKRYQDAIAAQEKAVDKAEVALKEFKVQANEFRGTLKDQSAEFMRKSEADARFDTLTKDVVGLQLSASRGEGGSAANAKTVGIIIAILTGIGGLIVALFKHQ
jgi:hypothetical protein